MEDLTPAAKSYKLKPFPNYPPPPPPISETSSPSSDGPTPIESSPSLPPVVLSSSNPISKRRYKNSGSFSQPLRPALYPRAGVLDSASSQASSQVVGGGALAREDSASSQQSKQSRESIRYARSYTNTARAQNIFKQHEDVVADIMCDIGQLQICQLGDTSLENFLARSDIPENATILQDFRKGIKSADNKSPVSTSCKPPPSYYSWYKSPPEVPTRPRKLQRRPRKDSAKTPVHGGIISSPIEASKDIHPGDISQPVTVADGVLQYSPYESLRSYNLSQPSAEEEDKFYTDLIARINKNIVRDTEPPTPTRDSYASVSSAGQSAGSEGTRADLTPEELLAARKANSERYGW
ncbi:hypothetical protein HOY82DRAFT_537452 [Tuber indicum]|nr:hypothetical protein HOY82DRAFT_537452 [Tuber indicum]